MKRARGGTKSARPAVNKGQAHETEEKAAAAAHEVREVPEAEAKPVRTRRAIRRSRW